MLIEIKVNSANEIIDIKLDTDNSIFICNGRNCNFSQDEFVDRLCVLVMSWDYSYGSNAIIDAEHFSVKILKDGECFNFEGCGQYPNNYSDFKNLITEVVNG